MSNITIRPVERPQLGWTLTTRIWLPSSVEEVFAFFADPGNLEALTPSWLHFRILTLQPIEMGEGSLIDYRLKLRSLPIRWRSEITDWHPPRRFVDRQLRGPYREWVHVHSFEGHNGGTTVHDEVTYSVPGGQLVHDWLVAPDLKRIFQFRHDVLMRQFTGESNQSPPTAGSPS